MKRRYWIRWTFLALAIAGGVNGRAEGTATPAADRLAAYGQHRRMAEESPFRLLKWRSLGPTAMSGRITDVDVPAGAPFAFYAAAASGGVWKTENDGTTWTPVFDGEAACSIGDIAVAPSDPNVLWVGTGENNSSRSTYAGTGVYRSTDGGKTWVQRGLADSHHIGRILVHPKDPRVAWAASIGHLYTPGGDKGVFKTTDGGETWAGVLQFPDQPHTGAIDLAMDPRNPDALYAAAWERFRRPGNFQEAGPGSAVYRSADGGRTWLRLAGGLPSGDCVGRIGLAVAPSKPDTVYALVDNQTPRPPKAKKGELTMEELQAMSGEAFLQLDKKKLRRFLRDNGVPSRITVDAVLEQVRSGAVTPAGIARTLYDANKELVSGSSVVGAEVYRSDDAGRTWRKVNEKLIGAYNTYGYYFGNLRVDPRNPERLFLLGVPLLASQDGGKSWKSCRGRGVHADHHALWIDPAEPRRIIDGNDGGINVSYDGAKTWKKFNNMPIAQFYTIALDDAEPYNVYGGLQDNGVWTGSSQSRPGPDEGWEMLLGGDGAYVQVDPADPDTVYTEYQFGNMLRLERKARKTANIKPFPKFGDDPYRFNWQTPILLSPHNRFTLYVGADKLLKSVDRGDTWVEISPDLTTNPAQGDVPYGTITTVDVSPLDPRRLYVGTDDGKVWTSPDDGGRWEAVGAGLPADRWVSRVVASRHRAGRVFVALTGYRDDDFAAYLFRSEDDGRTWTSVGGGLPAEPVNVVREDPEKPDVLYAGTDSGAYASLDGGRSWLSLRADLPTLPVYDLAVHPRERELVIGTHGRGVYVFDARLVEMLTPELLAEPVHLFAPAETFLPDEPWGGGEVKLRYYLQADAKEVALEVLDADGKVVAALKPGGERGLHEVEWDLKPVQPESKDAAAAKGDEDEDEEEEVLAEPGQYTVRLRADGREATQPLVVRPAKNPVDARAED